MPVWRDKRDGRWRYRFQHEGKRYAGSAPRDHNTKVAAEKAERDQLYCLEHPEEAAAREAQARAQPERKEVPTFGAFAEEFMRTYVMTNNKPSVQQSKRRVLRQHLLPVFRRKRLDEIRTRDIEKLKAKLLAPQKRRGRGMVKDKKVRSRKTVNNVLAILGKILRYAEEVEVIDKAPRIRLLKVEKQSFRFLDFEEYAALLKVAEAEPSWLTAILLGGDAGLRLGEIRALRLDDWDRLTGRITIARAFWKDIEGATKGWNRRTIPLTKRLASALRSERHLRGPFVLCDLDGKPLTFETMRWHLPRLCRRAGLRPIGWHALRHTFCSHLAMRGAPARTIQELAGHASLSTTLRYMHVVPGATDEAIALLDSNANKMPTNGSETRSPPILSSEPGA